MEAWIYYYSPIQGAVLATIDSVWPSDRLSHAGKTTLATITRSSLEDSPMTLVSSRLTSPQNSKGNMGSARAPNKRGVGKIGIFSQ